MKDKIKLGISGFDFSGSNKGCVALTYTFFSTLEKMFADKKIEVVNFGYTEDFDNVKKMYPNIKISYVRSNYRNPKYWASAIREMKDCTLFFDVTFGDSFSDIYGVGWNCKTNLIKQMALLSGTPLILLPQTYGPFEKKWLKNWAIRLVKKATYAYSRDELSADFLKKSGVTVKVAADMAFKLPYDKSMYTFSGTNKRIGVNISSLLWDSQWSKENHFGLTVDYHEFHEELLRYLLQDTDYEIHIIPHVIDLKQPDHRENDYRVCLEMKERYSEEIKEGRVYIAPPFDTPVEAKSYISNMNVFIGSRMHATIAAVSSGVATIPFSYSRKFEGLYGNIGYPYVISARKISTEEALENVKAWMEMEDELKESGKKASAISISKLDEFEKDVQELVNKLQ